MGKEPGRISLTKAELRLVANSCAALGAVVVAFTNRLMALVFVLIAIASQLAAMFENKEKV